MYRSGGGMMCSTNLLSVNAVSPEKLINDIV